MIEKKNVRTINPKTIIIKRLIRKIIYWWIGNFKNNFVSGLKFLLKYFSIHVKKKKKSSDVATVLENLSHFQQLKDYKNYKLSNISR